MEAATQPSGLPIGLRHAGFFILRTPLLPLESFTQWTDGSISEESLIQYMVKMLGRREVTEALYVASNSVHQRYYSQPDPINAIKDRKLLHSLLNYLNRMTTRCTPFGLFAGTSFGEIGAETSLQLPALQFNQRRTRIDLRFLEQLIDLLNSLEPSSDLRYIENNTAYEIGPYIRHMHWTVNEDGRHYQLGTADINNELRFVLEKAREGATFGELLAALRHNFPYVPGAEGEITEEEGLRGIVASKLLMPEWQLQITGGEPVKVLIDELGRYSQTRQIAQRLENTVTHLRRLDSRGITGNCTPYQEASESLGALGVNTDFQGLLKVDLFKPLSTGRLAESAVHALGHAVVKCQRLLPMNTARHDLLLYAENFERRFGDAEVPLTLALDDDCTNLPMRMDRHAIPDLDKLGIELRSQPEEFSWGTVESLLMRKLSESQRSGAQEIVLNDADFQSLPPVSPDLPPNFTIMASLLPQTQADAPQEWSFDMLARAGILARFAYGDIQLEKKIREYLRAEEASYPGCVLAELVHVPSATRRAENVLLRPFAHQYEIAYGARSGVALKSQIPISDLWIASRRRRFILRSASLGKEVIVRSSTAHNFSVQDALTPYWFLSALQFQGAYWGSFNWNRAFDALPFLPRVRVDSVIVSLARWRIEGSVVDQARSMRFADRQRWVTELRSKHHLPRYVSIGRSDQLLTIDLENLLSVECLLSEVKKAEDVVLTEVLDLRGTGAAQGPEGSFCTELIIPMVYERQLANPADAFVPPLSIDGVPGKPTGYAGATPGSEWLYAKIYCGVGVANRILVNVLPELAAEAQARADIDQWFFIRYRDPDFHLRIRFHGPDREKLWMFYLRLQDRLRPMLEAGFVARTQLDTYQPEVYRYGGIEAERVCEKLFHLDSVTICALLTELQADASRQLLWQLAFAGMDQILRSFDFSLEWRFNVARQLADGFAREFDISSPSKAKLSELYREHRPALTQILAGQTKEPELLVRGLNILSANADAYRTYVNELKRHLPSDPLHPTTFSVVSGLLHMHANRMFASKARTSETVLYDFLVRTYRSMQARGKQSAGRGDEKSPATTSGSDPSASSQS